MINVMNNFLWMLFIPFLIVMSIYLIFGYNKGLKRQIKSDKLKIKDVIGQVAISLGSMVGTGVIIGVLGSLSSIYIIGQNYFEAIVFWSIIGLIVLVPFAYMETIVAKVSNMDSKSYISILISPKAGMVYAIAFCALHIFGFGGFQFQGMNSVITILSDSFLGFELSEVQRYVFIIIPIIIFISIIILTKKHDIFISAMSLMIGFAIISYIGFAMIFLIKTSDYMNIFITNMIQGVSNPITSIIGVPIAMTLAFQRITQVSEPGLGAFALSSLDNNVKAKPSALVAAISSTLTIFISIFITTYIVSYGVSNGFINLNNSNSLELLNGYFLTSFNVVGLFGIVVLAIFALLSGLTTLLGSYYFLKVLFKLEFKKEFVLFITLLMLAGAVSIFGTMLIFDVVNLLMFIVAFINIVAIFVFIKNRKKNKNFTL